MRDLVLLPLLLLLGCPSDESAFGLIARPPPPIPDDDDVAIDDDDDEETPPEVEPGDWQHISSGDFHTCAINPQSALVCWGWNIFGQSSPPAGNFASVGAGWSHACAMKEDGSLECWGEHAGNDWGQGIAPTGTYAQLAVGSHHNCTLDDDGRLASCWGRSEHGQLAAPSRTWISKAPKSTSRTRGVRPTG